MPATALIQATPYHRVTEERVLTELGVAEGRGSCQRGTAEQTIDGEGTREAS